MLLSVVLFNRSFHATATVLRAGTFLTISPEIPDSLSSGTFFPHGIYHEGHQLAMR
jgi:hypothetical protein